MVGLLRTVAVLALACACASTADATVAAIVQAPITGEFRYNQLQLKFAESMQTWANASSNLVTLSPALRAECNWGGDTTLSCQLHNKPVSATRYRIAVQGGLKTQSGKVLPATVLYLETDRPTLSADIIEWQRGVPKIVVSTRDKVSAEQVAAVLRLQQDGMPVALPPIRASTTTDGWNDGRAFELDLGRLDGLPHRIALGVVPGLKSQSGPLLGTQRETLINAQVNESFQLRSLTCASPKHAVSAEPIQGTISADCLPGEPVQLLFSDDLGAVSRRAFETALPATVKLLSWKKDEDWRWRRPEDADQVSPAYRAELQIEAADTMTSIALTGVLRSASGAPLPNVNLRISTGDFRPELHAKFRKALIADRGNPPPAMMAINAETTIAVESIGAQVRDENVSVSTLSRPNKTIELASHSAAQSLNEGGWAQWRPLRGKPVADSDRSEQPVQFAAPGFDLFAVAGRNQVLAWANAWTGDQPISAAQVELLWLEKPGMEPRVLARATTGEDGVALLQLPPTFVQPESSDSAGYPLWLLRAAQGGDAGSARAVLPVPQTYPSMLGDAPETKSWGVADRPLYRAGDVVRYRLWQRELRGGRLMRVEYPKALKLRLWNSDEDKVVREWTVTPSDDGAIVGEVPLPIHLTDATYCIGTATVYSTDGICFFVGTYRAQDLWFQASTVDKVLHDGDPFSVDFRAGYYSGGPAAGVAVGNVTTMLTGWPLEQAYPQFGEYTFVDVMSDDARDGIPLADERSIKLVTDAQGRARATLPVRAKPYTSDEKIELPAFGRLQMVAEVKLAGREATASNAAQAKYSRFDRFVGLRLLPMWFDANTPVRMQGVVIDANGKAIANASVDVDVEFFPGWDPIDKTKPQWLTHCHLAIGRASDCNFQRQRSGRYRLTARSDHAASAEITRYVWVGNDSTAVPGASTELQLLEAPPAPGAPARLLLKQGNAKARVLFVFGSGDEIAGYRVETVTGGASEHLLPISADWHRQIAVTAYVRPMGVAPEVKDGYRTPVVVTSDLLQVPLIDPVVATAPLALSFSAGSAHPGDRVRVVLRNNGGTPRDVVLTVVDDALRALAADWLPYFDPKGKYWLGEELPYNFGKFGSTSFGDWNSGEEWRLVLPIPDIGKAGNRSEEFASAQDEAPPVVFDAPSPVAVVAPPPKAMAGGDRMLQKVEVTGTRIKRAEVFAAGHGLVSGLRPRAQDQSTDGNVRLRLLARLRSQFVDTALWQPSISLAPGESREVELILPDNLTRWRAIAWSSDGDSDFDMAEATIETGLPVEVRLQAPVRIYPGDRARLAANVRQVAAVASRSHATLHVEGVDTPNQSEQTVPLAAGGQGAFALEIAPHETGSIVATAQAQTAAGGDAVAASVEVASPRIAARKVQAGWLDDQPITLDIPALPAGASGAYLQVSLLRGGSGLSKRWTEDLRDYPHRCWEQILSRAVAAALAIDRGDASDWPDAAAVVDEAVDNASVFQGEDGNFRFFAEEPVINRNDDSDPKPEIALTAYSVRALALLRSLGHPASPAVEKAAADFLADWGDLAKSSQDEIDDAALAASAGDPITREKGDALWQAWPRLSLTAQVAAAAAMARSENPASRDAVQRILAHAPVHGHARVLQLDGGSVRWMSSEMQEQCALIDLLRGFPQLAAPDTRVELLAGLNDLYAGGIEAVDTQTGAYCLMALRDNGPNATAASAPVTLRLAGSAKELSLPAGQAQAEWQIPLTAARQLQIEPGARTAMPLSYIAELRYQEDGRRARNSAVGFSIERRYDVLRAGHWAPITASVREGDWIRVTLIARSAAPRYFVAMTDAVPGGLQPTDLSLSSVAGLDLGRISDTGSYVFATRRLDPRTPRFYAEYLPPGEHQVHYFARAGNAGDFLAAPATMELMYGNASSARTAAARVHIVATAASPK
jgi:hypothetical protein